MSYTVENFKTKKALTEAFKSGKRIAVFEPGPFTIKDGKVFLEGPHSPEPHRWYCAAIVKRGIIVKLLK